MLATSFDWNAVAGVCAVIGVAAAAGRLTYRGIKNWLATRREDDSRESKMWTALFGHKGDGSEADPDSTGLVLRVNSLETKVDVLLARTEENHGSSLRDLLVAVCGKLDIPVPPVSESQKVPETPSA